LNERGNQVMRWPRRLRSAGNHRVPLFESALFVVFVFLLASPVANDSPNVVALRAKRAQDFVDQLRAVFPITEPIQIAVVVYHPLVFSVQPMDIRKDRFLLSMELGFFLTLKDDELRAALAHELGHVWIYTHYPFLQTERLANMIGQRAADRASFERLYSRLWAYEGSSGVPIDDLLGPSLEGPYPARPAANETRP